MNNYKRLLVLTVSLALALGILIFLKNSSLATKFLWNISNEGTNRFPLVSVSALIDAINPCAFSVLLLTIAFLFSLGLTRGKLLKIGFAYIAGIYVAYLFIGLGLLQALHIFNTPHFMGKLGSILLIVLGLINVITHFFPSFPIKLAIPKAAHAKMADLMDKSSMPAVFALGALVGLCEFPCTGGPYLMVIGLLHDSGTYLRGLGYLIWYNILFVAPLIAVLLYSSDRSTLDRVVQWKRENLNQSRLVGGIIMVALGILILYV